MAKRNRKQTPTRRAAGARRTTRRSPTAAGERALAAVRQHWQAAVGSLSAADTELRRQLRTLKKETASRTRTLDAHLKDLQARARKEGRAFARSAEDTVERALGALNIPTRQDVDRLSRKVEELTRKLDRRRGARGR
jgi:Poly(hydroxyalcanoate) granule associated protein (phasin)